MRERQIAEKCTPSLVRECLNQLERTHETILRTSSEVVSVQIERASFKVLRAPVGFGITAVVYALHGEERVLKLARPKVRYLRAMISEEHVARALEQVDLGPFCRVPRSHIFHPNGLYIVRDLVRGQTLTEILLRTRAIIINGSDGRPYPALETSNQATDLLLQLGPLIESLLAVRARALEFVSDIGPDNIIVTFQDADYKSPERLYLVDLAPASSSTRALFEGVSDLSGYVAAVVPLVERYLKTGFLRFTE
jgi:hypothetical protein